MSHGQFGCRRRTACCRLLPVRMVRSEQQMRAMRVARLSLQWRLQSLEYLYKWTVIPEYGAVDWMQ
jgi:hypothetical protein